MFRDHAPTPTRFTLGCRSKSQVLLGFFSFAIRKIQLSGASVLAPRDVNAVDCLLLTDDQFPPGLLPAAALREVVQ